MPTRPMKISKKTRDILAYLIGGTVVVAGTLLLVAIANGWQYNVVTGEITETGLILMGSEPNGATITLNDKVLRQKTNYRYSSAPVGEYTIRYEKDQFRPWTSVTSVQAGQVTFSDHAWLIPNNIPQRNRYESLQISQAYQTEDRKRFILVDSTQPSSPLLYTSTDLKRPPVVLLTNNQLSAAAGGPVTQLDSLQFSDDASQMLFRVSTEGGSVAWLTAGAAPASQPTITNLTQTLLFNPTWISWVPRGNNEISYIEKGTLRRVQIREKNISEALAENVISARWSEEWLVYVSTQATANQPATTTQKLFIRPIDASSNNEIATLPLNGQSFETRYIRALDRDYIALLNEDTKILTLYTGILRNPGNRTASAIGRNVSAITVSPNNRFLTHNASDQMVTLDFERFKRYRANTSLEGLTDWAWMNDQHLALKLGTNLKLVDYDGQNSELIADSLLLSSPILFSENKTLLNIATQDTKLLFTQSYIDPEKFTE